MTPIHIAIISISLSVLAQFCLKIGMSSTSAYGAFSSPVSLKAVAQALLNPYILVGFFLYGFSAIVWLAVLARWDVSKAYPLVGLGIVLTLIIGAFIGEQVSYYRIIGVLLICSGIFFVSQS